MREGAGREDGPEERFALGVEGEIAATARALAEAMETGEFGPADVKHVNAHATSTPKGDAPEAGALRRAFGSAVDDMCVSATKSMTGHILGGSGAVEAVLTVLAVHHRTAPCTINLENQDPEIDLDVVTAGDPVVAEAWQRAEDRQDPEAARTRRHRTAEEQHRYENHIRHISPLPRRLGYLAAAGFEGVDVFWRRLELVLMGGRRPA